MTCLRCQTENPPTAKFCGSCGGAFEVPCPKSGHGNPPGGRFCHDCGGALDPHAPTPGRFPSPQTYTPAHLAEKILASRGTLQDETKTWVCSSGWTR